MASTCASCRRSAFTRSGARRWSGRAWSSGGFAPEYVQAALATCLGKVRVFSELPAYAGFYFRDELELRSGGRGEAIHAGESARGCEAVREAFAASAAFDAAAIEATLKATAARAGREGGRAGASHAARAPPGAPPGRASTICWRCSGESACWRGSTRALARFS